MFRCSFGELPAQVAFLKCWNFLPFFLLLLSLYLFGFGFDCRSTLAWDSLSVAQGDLEFVTIYLGFGMTGNNMVVLSRC